MTYTSEKNRGITLVECVIVLFIVGLITLFICTFFITQTKHYNREEQITKMQQDLRTGLMIMVKDIREAGYDPTGMANAGFVDSDTNMTSIGFTKDTDNGGDGACDDLNENILYSFSDNNLLRNGRIKAENIENLEFNYILSDGNSTTAPADCEQIRLVQITMLARTRSDKTDFVDTKTYTRASGGTWGPYNDNFKRWLLTTTVKCRNMAL
ncbi:MAG: PilW family protein [bacterium]